MKRRDFSGVVKIKRPIGMTASVAQSTEHPIAKIQSRKEVRDLDIDMVMPSPEQPRKHFKTDKLRELAESIKAKGVLQPIAVERVGEGFRIIHGERRWRASKLAGVTTIPSIVMDKIDDLTEIRLIENIQREDLLPEEIAVNISKAIKDKGCTHEEFSVLVGKSPGYISKCIKIASFLSDRKVAVVVKHLRDDESFVFGFERLYEAACCKTPDEGIIFLSSVVEKKLSTTSLRITKDKRWDTKKIVRCLKNVHGKLDFTFKEKIGVVIGDDVPIVVKEVEMAIVALREGIASLEQVRKDLQDKN